MVDKGGSNDDEPEREVIQPDPIESAKKDPGKKVIKHQGSPDMIRHVDVVNATYMAFYSGLADQIRETAMDVQSSLDEDSDRPVGMPLDELGAGIFGLHTLTVTFFESSSWVICRWALKVDAPLADDILDHMYEKVNPPNDEKHKDKYDFKKNLSRDKRLRGATKYLKEDGNAGFYQSIFASKNIIDDEFNDLLFNVRTRRNNYVHQPMNLVNLNDSTDVLIQIDNCIDVVERTEDLVESRLPIDEDFREAFLDD